MMRLGWRKHLCCPGLVVLFILFSSGRSPAACAATLQQQVRDQRSSDLKDFDKFLDDHPAVVPDLRRDPSLMVDPDYLEQHPDLKQFLTTHPGFEGTVTSELKTRNCFKTAPAIFDQVSP